jgi:hypothetical protein
VQRVADENSGILWQLQLQEDSICRPGSGTGKKSDAITCSSGRWPGDIAPASRPPLRALLGSSCLRVGSRSNAPAFSRLIVGGAPGSCNAHWAMAGLERTASASTYPRTSIVRAQSGLLTRTPRTPSSRRGTTCSTTARASRRQGGRTSPTASLSTTDAFSSIRGPFTPHVGTRAPSNGTAGLPT